MRFTISTLVLAFGISFSQFTKAAEHIVMSTDGGYFKPPFKIAHKGKPDSGILPDMFRLLEERTNSRVMNIPISRSRVDDFMALGRSDITCHTHPDWLRPSDDLHFVKTYRSEDVYVARKSLTFDFENYDTLNGARIGTIKSFGYDKIFYKALEYGAQHYPVRNFKNNWIKLDIGKIDALIVADYIAEYQLKNPHYAEKFNIIYPAPTNEHWRYCAIRKSHSISGMLIKTLNMMREDQDIESIIAKYTK